VGGKLGVDFLPQLDGVELEDAEGLAELGGEDKTLRLALALLETLAERRRGGHR
jgi:hypothetical protein